MKISRIKFESEMDSLISAALSSSNKITAQQYLTEADNKIDGYDIESSLKQEYRTKVLNAEREINRKFN